MINARADREATNAEAEIHTIRNTIGRCDPSSNVSPAIKPTPEIPEAMMAPQKIGTSEGESGITVLNTTATPA
jgi:hypothetical protein